MRGKSGSLKCGRNGASGSLKCGRNGAWQKCGVMCKVRGVGQCSMSLFITLVGYCIVAIVCTVRPTLD